MKRKVKKIDGWGREGPQGSPGLSNHSLKGFEVESRCDRIVGQGTEPSKPTQAFVTFEKGQGPLHRLLGLLQDKLFLTLKYYLCINISFLSE